MEKSHGQGGWRVHYHLNDVCKEAVFNQKLDDLMYLSRLAEAS